jgi:Fe-S cluster biogenesis protein NfuA
MHVPQCRSARGGYDSAVPTARPIDPRRLTEVRLLVDEVIEELRPGIQEDDGDVELVDVTAQGVVQVRFKGACVRCPSSGLTLHGGIERAVREAVPEIDSVVAVS